eukprot:93888-Hanusia_phi.AAC.2
MTHGSDDPIITVSDAGPGSGIAPTTQDDDGGNPPGPDPRPGRPGGLRSQRLIWHSPIIR